MIETWIKKFIKEEYEVSDLKKLYSSRPHGLFIFSVRGLIDTKGSNGLHIRMQDPMEQDIGFFFVILIDNSIEGRVFNSTLVHEFLHYISSRMGMWPFRSIECEECFAHLFGHDFSLIQPLLRKESKHVKLYR